MRGLLPQPGGFEGGRAVHVSLHANDAPVTQMEDGRRVDAEFYPAALTALVFPLEDNDLVPSVDELLWLEPVLIPYLVVLDLEPPPDPIQATRNQVFFEATDRPVQFHIRIDQLRQPVPVPSIERLVERFTISTFSCDIAHAVSGGKLPRWPAASVRGHEGASVDTSGVGAKARRGIRLVAGKGESGEATTPRVPDHSAALPGQRRVDEQGHLQLSRRRHPAGVECLAMQELGAFAPG